MSEQPTCFVIMGFGKKTDFESAAPWTWTSRTGT
jgi:hypothetical protein